MQSPLDEVWESINLMHVSNKLMVQLGPESHMIHWCQWITLGGYKLTCMKTTVKHDEYHVHNAWDECIFFVSMWTRELVPIIGHNVILFVRVLACKVSVDLAIPRKICFNWPTCCWSRDDGWKISWLGPSDLTIFCVTLMFDLSFKVNLTVE